MLSSPVRWRQRGHQSLRHRGREFVQQSDAIIQIEFTEDLSDLLVAARDDEITLIHWVHARKDRQSAILPKESEHDGRALQLSAIDDSDDFANAQCRQDLGDHRQIATAECIILGGFHLSDLIHARPRSL